MPSTPQAGGNIRPNAGRERGCPRSSHHRAAGPCVTGREGCLLFSLTQPRTARQQPSLSEFQAPDPGLDRARGESLGSGLRPGCQQSSAQHPRIRRDQHPGKQQFLRVVSHPLRLGGSISCLPSQPSTPQGPGRRGGASRQPPLPTPAFRSRLIAAKVCPHEDERAGFAIPRATLLRQGRGHDGSWPLPHHRRSPRSSPADTYSRSAACPAASASPFHCGVPSGSSCTSPAPGAASTR